MLRTYLNNIQEAWEEGVGKEHHQYVNNFIGVGDSDKDRDSLYAKEKHAIIIEKIKLNDLYLMGTVKMTPNQ